MSGAYEGLCSQHARERFALVGGLLYKQSCQSLTSSSITKSATVNAEVTYTDQQVGYTIV